MLGYNYGEEIQNAEVSGLIKMERVSSQVLNFRKLLAGRVAAVPELMEVGYDLLKKAFTPGEVAQITTHPKPYRTADYYLIVSKKDPKNEAIIQAFNRGLDKLKKSGAYDRIFGKLQG